MEYTFRNWYIPERMMGGLERYIDKGIPPGDFLQAIIENNFVEACSRADDENLMNLQAYAAYLYNKIPRSAWGSEKTMKCWMEMHRKKMEETNQANRVNN